MSEWVPVDGGGVADESVDGRQNGVLTPLTKATRDVLRDCLRLAARAERIAEELEREREGTQTWIVSSKLQSWDREMPCSTATLIHRHLAAVERLSGRRVLVAALPPRYTEESCRDLAEMMRRLLDAWPHRSPSER